MDTIYIHPETYRSLIDDNMVDQFPDSKGNSFPVALGYRLACDKTERPMKTAELRQKVAEKRIVDFIKHCSWK